MKKTILLGFVLSLLYACTSNIERVVVQTYPDGSVELEKYFIIKNNDSILVKETGYYQNGIKRIEGSYKDSERHGKWNYWFEDGNQWSEGYFSRGQRNGKSIVWHENGKKYFEGTYKMDERVGIWRFWDEDGELEKEINYDK